VAFELDFDEVVQRKYGAILKHQEMQELIEFTPHVGATASTVAADVSKQGLHTSCYHLIAADLSERESVAKRLLDAGIDTGAPTLFLSECVLIYLKPQSSDDLIRWAAETFQLASFCTYEQVRPDDPFGVTMIENLQKRGCPLLGIHAYPTVAAQKKRYSDLGWERVESLDMYEIYNKVLSKTEKQRAERLEMFDEFEEWKLIQEHYCLVWAFLHKHATQQSPQQPGPSFWDQCGLRGQR